MVFKLTTKEMQLIKDNQNKSLRELGLIKVDSSVLKLKRVNESVIVQKPLKQPVKGVNKGFVSVLKKSKDNSKQFKLNNMEDL